MAGMGRRVAMAILTAGAILAARDSTAQPSEAHVRSFSPAIVALMQRASERSATFRQLVQIIEQSDSYVYVDEGTCRQDARACFVTVTKAGPKRIMWVLVDTRKADWDWDLMGSIGHELRHTIEAIEDASVTDGRELYRFYEDIGRHRDRMRETQAAIDAGRAVREEVRKFNRSFP